MWFKFTHTLETSLTRQSLPHDHPLLSRSNKHSEYPYISHIKYKYRRKNGQVSHDIKVR